MAARSSSSHKKKHRTSRQQFAENPSYLQVIENFAGMMVFVNNQGDNFLGNDARVIAQVEAQIDALGRILSDTTQVSFWEVDGDELMLALPEGDNMLAVGINEILEGMMAADPLHKENGDIAPPPVFMIYTSLQAAVGMWFEEQAYPIIRDRVFPIPRSFGASFLVSDSSAESFDVWRDDEQPLSPSVTDAVRATLHTHAIIFA